MTDLGVALRLEQLPRQGRAGRLLGHLVRALFARDAAWCAALYDELSASGFDVVAISLDEDLEALAKFLQETQGAVGEPGR